MEYKAQRGTVDILPKDQNLWNYVQQQCFDVARSFGYSYIETPIFEDSRIFERTVGEDTDIVEKEIISTFEKHNLKQIQPLGEKFDYNFHQAMFEAPMPDSKAGEIIQIMAVGFKIGDRLLRPAQVGVSSKSN